MNIFKIHDTLEINLDNVCAINTVIRYDLDAPVDKTWRYDRMYHIHSTTEELREVHKKRDAAKAKYEKEQEDYLANRKEIIIYEITMNNGNKHRSDIHPDTRKPECLKD